MTKVFETAVRFLVVLSVFGAMSFTQTEPSDRDALKSLNAEVVENYRAWKLDDAAKAAHASLKLTIKLYGEGHLETALVYSNLAEIYSRKEKNDLALSYFTSAWKIHRKNSFVIPSKSGNIIVRLTQVWLHVKKDELLRTELEELKNLAESGDAVAKRIYPHVLSALTAVYVDAKLYELADEMFLKRYALFSKLTPQNLSEFESLDADRKYYEKSISGRKDSEKRQKAFEAALRTQSGDDFVLDGVFYRARRSEATLGKALSLAKPDYPPAARAVRAGGQVRVRVLIAEDGSVLNADAISGHPLLRHAAETAARKSKFSPTLLAGQRVKVRSVLIYNFVP